jgi:hypothetical protein
MFGASDATQPPAIRGYVLGWVTVGLVLTLCEPWLERMCQRHLERWGRVHYAIRGAGYAALALGIIFLGGSSQKFIYFDF